MKTEEFRKRITFKDGRKHITVVPTEDKVDAHYCKGRNKFVALHPVLCSSCPAGDAIHVMMFKSEIERYNEMIEIRAKYWENEKFRTSRWFDAGDDE